MKTALFALISTGLLCTAADVRAQLAKPQIIEADVCIYGGTSGGVAAAVQAARMGKRAIIAEPGKHLGGMTSGGLSAVDIGDPRTVGGIAREYFTRLVASYGKELEWAKAFQNKRGGPATGGAYSIEPHVAERVFNTMTREAKVPVHFGARLASVKKNGARIAEFVTEDGTVFRAKMFIDATYEGDLMAKAGVSYTLMREGNAKYGAEIYNGIYYSPQYRPRAKHLQPGPNGRLPGGQGVWDRDFPLDPYTVPGDPRSGLLPLINAGEPGKPGDPAPGVQAYCYRLCLTTAADRLPIRPPLNYDPKRFEIVARFIDACIANGDDMDLRWFSKHDPLPNAKWDFNTATWGGNLPGASWEWPEASYARREVIAKDHEDYHRGLLHFLATDPRVPVKVRNDMQRFGLPRDEFIDNGGWPHQLYIREARRMVSDLVMTELHTFVRETAPDSIGLGSYGTDVHEIRRIVKDGVVTREGKVAGGRDGAPPYGIGYAAIVPKRGECENLFVTFALSASHSAFGSIRMEPVLMVTSQSAATAACIAIDDKVPVQAVDRAKLRTRLLKDGQVLAWSDAKKPASSHAKSTTAELQTPKRKAAIADTAVAVRPKQTVAHEPAQLAKDAKPADVDGKSYDLVVVGGTPGGVACAVRGAREGLSVLLVNRHDHLGGILASGLGVWDTQWEGKRSPIYDEVRAALFDYYRTNYGADSQQYRDALPGKSGHSNGRFEPHVAEKIITAIVAREKNVAVLRSFIPAAVERDGTLLKSLTVRPVQGGRELAVRAAVFADCSYEGDLAALAKVPYRVGREARAEFGEPHAGIIFMQPRSQAPTPEAAQLAKLHDALQLRKFAGWQVLLPQSTGAADEAVQACNYRTMLTTDPKNRVPISKPANYDPYFLKSLEVFSGVKSIPNGKFGWNRPQLVGRQTPYVEADWATRQRIMDEHWEATLGLLYFLQNDPTVPEIVRRAWLEYGLAKDEFADHGHRPYEMYIREARRIHGRAVYTQHDAMLAPGLRRAPIHDDSIAITEWYMDSHSCTTARVPGGLEEGKAMLHQQTFPGQLPYRCLLPQGVDNLLVPVCLSATHVAWGTVRLEPVFMQTGEAAGLAAALALKNQTTPARLNPNKLVRRLCELRSMIAFFNDVNVADDKRWVPALQYFGTRGFFHDYDARVGEALKFSTGKAWADGLAQLSKDELDPNALARAVAKAEHGGGKEMTAAEFAALLPASKPTRQPAPQAVISRSAALSLMFSRLP
jgi:flavin-dependent dehydrogenase